MTHSLLIDQVGGTTVVARAFGVKLPIVSMWRKRGIPWPRRSAFARLAESKNVKIPEGFFEPISHNKLLT